MGFGLAGMAITHKLLAAGKTVLVFDEDSEQGSSVVAGGLYNPVILKRFTLAWKATEQLHEALPFYREIENKFKKNYIQPLGVCRKFASIEEQNMWFVAADKPSIQPYLNTTLVKNNNPYINAPLGFGSLFNTGRLKTLELLSDYKEYLTEIGAFKKEAFNYAKLKITSNTVLYDEVKADSIVFSEGFGLKKNPFFKQLPLMGTKGELLTIKAPDLNLDFVLKSTVFLIPLGDGLYKVGATYNWDDKTTKPTIQAREFLENNLKKLITCNYQIVNQEAGIRPTVKDRRPLIGQHKKYKNMYVLNGLGTRGVMLAPYTASILFDCITAQKSIPKEVNITRFVT